MQSDPTSSSDGLHILGALRSGIGIPLVARAAWTILDAYKATIHTQQQEIQQLKDALKECQSEVSGYKEGRR